MGFSGNFTRVTLGADPEADGARTLFVEGRTDDSADPPLSIHVVLPRNGKPLTATVETPTLIDWEVKFPEDDVPFTISETGRWLGPPHGSSRLVTAR